VEAPLKGPFLKTAVALVLLVGLGSWIYFVELKKTPGDQKKKEKLFTVERAKVKELTLTRGGESVRLVREGEGWRLTAPTTAPADTEAVNGLLGALEGLELDAVAEDKPAALAPFGLDPPKTKLQATVEGASAPLELLIGDEVPAAGGVYAKKPAETRVIVIPSWSASSLDKKPFDLRDRDLLHVKRDDVKTLAVAGGGIDYALAKDDKGEWAFTKPIQARAGRWSVDGLLGTVEGLRMDSVGSEDAKDLKPYGLVKPARTVTLGLAGGGSKVLELGSAAPGDKKIYARPGGSSLVAVVPSGLEEQIAKGMKDLRANRLQEIATYEVEGFEATEGAVKKVYAKTTTKDKDGFEKPQWKRTQPDAKDLDTTKVEDALFKLGGVEVQEFIDAPKDPKTYGLDAPVLTLAVRLGAAKGEAKVEIGRKDGTVYARRGGEPSVLKLDAAKTDELIKAFREL
jgi:hypothetical protein